MSFRPLPVLTIISILLLAFLIHLGIWQFQRAEWKAGEIAAYKARTAGVAESIEEVFCQSGKVDGISVLANEGTADANVRVYGFSTSGAPGWHVYTTTKAPSCLEHKGDILTEIGFEPFQSGRVDPIGRIRVAPLNPNRGTFSSDNNPADNEWYWLELPAIQTALLDNRGQINPDWVLVADDGMPSHLRKTPPERHIGYSVTWFGMAIVLLVMYAAYHIHTGRLRFGR